MSPSLEGDGYPRLERLDSVEWYELRQEAWNRFQEGFSLFLREQLEREFERRVEWQGIGPLAHALRGGVPRQEVDLSPEAMERVRASLDDVCERYGTSGELEVRGYWMPLDVEFDHRDARETQA